MNAYQKTEALLYDFQKYKLGAEMQKSYKPEKTLVDNVVENVEKALETLKDDDYAGIIELYYFERHTNEYIAELFDIATGTAYERRKKLINRLKIILFADDTLKELLEE